MKGNRQIMLRNTAKAHAHDSTLLLNAAAYCLDRNLTIRDTQHSDVARIAYNHRADVSALCRHALDAIPISCPSYLRQTFKLEADSLNILARVSGKNRPVIHNRNSRAIGKSGFPAYTVGELNLVGNSSSSVEGLLHTGKSSLGVSCIFTVQHSASAGTEGFWVDNLTGLPIAEWLEHRAENLNYINQFIGGPWNGKELLDEDLLSARSLKYSSIFTDYEAQRFSVIDKTNGTRFRFAWNENRTYSNELLADSENVSNLKAKIDKYS